MRERLSRSQNANEGINETTAVLVLFSFTTRVQNNRKAAILPQQRILTSNPNWNCLLYFSYSTVGHTIIKNEFMWSIPRRKCVRSTSFQFPAADTCCRLHAQAHNNNVDKSYYSTTRPINHITHRKHKRGTEATRKITDPNLPEQLHHKLISILHNKALHTEPRIYKDILNI